MAINLALGYGQPSTENDLVMICVSVPLPARIQPSRASFNTNMAFFDPDLHAQQQHAAVFEYHTFQGPLCLACFLHSIADAGQLDSRKIFVLREFVRVFGPEGPEGAEPLRQLLSQHAPMLAAGLLTACTTSQDIGLGEALQETAAAMCSCAPEYVPELLTERALQLLLELPWPNSTDLAHPDLQHSMLQTHTTEAYAAAAICCCVRLLQQLVSTYSAAARRSAVGLAQSEQLATVMCAGLSCGLEAIVTPLLQVFSVLLASNSTSASAAAPASSMAPGGCCFPPAVVRELFIQLLLLAPQLSSPELKGLALRLLLHLVSTGNALEQATQPSVQPPTAAATALLTHSHTAAGSQVTGVFSQQQQASQQQYSQYQQQQYSQYQQQQYNQHQQQQQVEQQVAALAAALMAAVKPALLDTDLSHQLLGCQLLAAVAARAPAVLLQQLMAVDACEHMFQVLRGTLSSCSMGASLLELQQRQQHKQGPLEALPPDGLAAVTACDDLQATALSALRCLSTQGPAFQEHLHLGLDTLTNLMQHAVHTCNTPTLSTALALLCDALAPQPLDSSTDGSNGGSSGASSGALLPAAALGRLAAAAVAVLPSVAADDAAAVGAHAQELQPTPEMQQSIEQACRLLSLLCSRFCVPSAAQPSAPTFTTSSSRTATQAALTPHILEGAQKAQLVLSIMGSRGLVSGCLTAAAQLLEHAVLLLGNSLAAVCAAQQQQQQLSQQHHQQQQNSKVMAASSKGQQQQQRPQQLRRSKGSNNTNSSSTKGGRTNKGSKQPRQAAPQDKLFTRRAQQQHSQQQQSSQCGVTGGDLDKHEQGLVEDLLCLFESTLLCLLPAAVKGWEALGLGDAAHAAAAGGMLGAWQPGAAQETHQVAVEMLQAVLRVLQAVLDTGASCPSALSAYMGPFSQQLLSSSGASWTSVSLDLLSLLQLPPALAVDVWSVLLAAASQLQGPAFLGADARPNLSPLATSLASKVGNRLQLLQLLCSNPAPNNSTDSLQQQPQAPNNTQGALGGGSSGGSRRRRGGSNGGRGGSNGGRGGSNDIRRFCGLSELHRAALCIVAAALYCGDLAWDLGDVLTAADAAVGHAGPAMLSQPELLLNVVRLYAQVEAQHKLDLQQQQVLQLQAPADSAAATAAAGQHMQQQWLQQLPPPAAIAAVVERLSPVHLAGLHPSDAAALWILGIADVLPTAASKLLLLWMQQLIAARAVGAPAAAAEPAAKRQAGARPAGPNPAAHQQQQQQQQQQLGHTQMQCADMLEERCQQQQELCQAVLAALQGHPAAVQAALLLLQDCLQSQQQQHTTAAAAWLAVLAAVLLQSSKQHQRQEDHSSSSGDGNGSTSSSAAILQLLLFGVNRAPDAAIATAMATGGGAGTHNMPGSSSGSAGVMHGLGLLTLTRRILTSASTAVWASNWSSCYLMHACACCLAAAATAFATPAAAEAAQGGVSQDVQQWLLQQGLQQVQLLAARVGTVTPQHPLYQPLLWAAGSAAAAWMHAAAVSGADGEQLQQLAGNAAVSRVMEQAAVCALGRQCAAKGAPQQQQPQATAQQQGVLSEGATAASTAPVQPLQLQGSPHVMLEQLLVHLYQHADLLPAAAAGPNSSAASRVNNDVAAAGGVVHGLAALQQCFAGDSSSSSREVMLMPVLLWQQHLQWLQLAGIFPVQQQQQASHQLPLAGPVVPSGLTHIQMLLLVQAHGPCLLSLLLLNSLTLLFQQWQQHSMAQHRPAAAAASQLQQQLQQQGQLPGHPVPWVALLTVLQNTVAAASVPGACNWRYAAAATHCLAALYAAAEAHISSAAAAAAIGSDGLSGTNRSAAATTAALVVANSPWNGAVVQAAVERLCQKAVELQAVAAAATAADAASGMHSGSSGGCGVALGYSWLNDAEAQQHLQLWCADAQLLVSFVQLAAAAAEGSSSSKGVVSSRGALGLQQLQALLQPYLEQQRLLPAVCWGAGQCYSSCQALLLAEQQQMQQQPEEEKEGSVAHKAAACCLSMQFSGMCLALLEALLLSSCLTRQLPLLKQQLQQQAANIFQQQQQLQQQFGSAQAAAAGLQQFAARCVAAGAVRVLCPLRVGEACVCAGLQASDMALLLAVYGGRGASGGLVCEPLEVLPALQALLQQLD